MIRKWRRLIQAQFSCRVTDSNVCMFHCRAFQAMSTTRSIDFLGYYWEYHACLLCSIYWKKHWERYDGQCCRFPLVVNNASDNFVSIASIHVVHVEIEIIEVGRFSISVAHGA